ncbi:hypothetical protein Pint_31004 [Pistacia integerrima]|uniref:Uncharacterized protein n=1 Tax=Pistacia integerrima TaxID=434235 RepID=A0ACC0XQW6_9ROSI|nr:hypothetical protein Pint_31004 [Pistacia integerrima]
MKLISISKPTPYSGWFFIVIGSVSFLGFLFAAIISKLFPPFDNPILSAIQNDSITKTLNPCLFVVVLLEAKCENCEEFDMFCNRNVNSNFNHYKPEVVGFGEMFCVFHGVGRVCLAVSEGRLVRFRWENLNWYYCFLVPLTLPMIVVAVYFHWLSMKLFKHA